METSVLELISNLLIVEGWTLYPYNRDDNGQFYEWIVTEQPLLSDLGRAYRFRKL